eukprot:COSAG02_NODE_1016_length_15190_cov_128.667418_6_plen_146_part_00
MLRDLENRISLHRVFKHTRKLRYKILAPTVSLKYNTDLLDLSEWRAARRRRRRLYRGRPRGCRSGRRVKEHRGSGASVRARISAKHRSNRPGVRTAPGPAVRASQLAQTAGAATGELPIKDGGLSDVQLERLKPRKRHNRTCVVS